MSLSFVSKNASAQIVVIPPAKATVTTDIRFVPMKSADFVVKPNGGGYVEQDSAPVSCTFSLGVLAKTYTLVSCSWTGLDFKGQTGATATGIAHNPGVVSVGCVATVSSKGGLSTISATSKSLFVVGGPISTSVFDGAPGTPLRDWTDLANGDSPSYLQYFGFDPDGTIPPGAQTPQKGTAYALGGQPTGTTYSWSLPGALEVYPKGGSLTGFSVNLAGTSGTGGKPVEPVLTYTFTNPDTTDPVTGSCKDDSLQDLNSDGTPMQSAFMFDVHVPVKLLFQYTSSAGATLPNYGYAIQYAYFLMDDSNSTMLGVDVVERWEKDWGDGSGYLWPSGTGFPNGFLTDSFSDWDSVPHLQADGNPLYGSPFTHRYYAATTDTSYYKAGVTLSGILVLTTTTTYYTDIITNK